MARIHPHADATYRTIRFSDGTFGVEIAIPGTHPTTMRSFATEAKAAEWIAEHKNFVASNSSSDRVWRRKAAEPHG
jgi:hypothetical protein